MHKFLVSFILLILVSLSLKAKEGMWLPLLVEKYNIGEMKADGFKLSAEDIYSVNQASMNDGIVQFGAGCTGVLVSDEGLLFTNHHCGFRYIQRHSSVEHDYLTNGFWAMNRSEELSNPALTVTFLREMRDVSKEVLLGVEHNMTIEKREELIQNNIDSLISKEKNDNGFKTEINEFFEGNQYFMFISQVFNDVRLVGAPPSSIGGFGGNIDNWMWPRHGGDFSIFRIYADSANNPKAFSDDNVPYKPAYHFPVSLNGVQEGDFTMVFGYPGSTQQYKTSHHLNMLVHELYPELIHIRDLKLEVLEKQMNADADIRIKYASKEASISNSWKRWKGEIMGLNRFNVIDKKIAFEKEFQKWASDKPIYRYILADYASYYQEYSRLNTEINILNELFGPNSMECFSKASVAYNNLKISELRDKSPNMLTIRNLYNDYHPDVDKELSVKLLSYLIEYTDNRIIPEELSRIYAKKKSINKTVEYLYKKSFIEDSAWIADLDKKAEKLMIKLEKDPFRLIYNQYQDIYNSKLVPERNKLKSKIDSLDNIYMKGLMTFDSSQVFFPDANSTLRLGYGKVMGYEPRDGVYYKHYTSSEGILQKDNPNIYDYNIPDLLRELLKKKDFGPYGADGLLPVCFVATNHTTGGNSGSPVFNASGELIGLNFDRAWDGVMSDLYYNPQICRNVTVDIRYVLFIIDKFAGAGYLLEEMSLKGRRQ